VARSDLLVSLVKTGASGDIDHFREAVEAVIADERAKKHAALADRLADELTKNGAAPAHFRPSISHNGTAHVNRNGAVQDLWVEMTPSRALDDLVLPDNVTTVCRELVEEHRRGELLRSRGLQPRNRILVAGPTGNGKTAVAEALASALAAPLVVARYDGLIAGDFAETGARLGRLFDRARAGCVLFFDDVDGVGKERGDGRETGEVKQAVGSLLLEIDDLPAHVVVIAAVNRPELLDRAVRRRFQVRLELPPPTAEQTVKFFEKAAPRAGVPFGYPPRMLAQMLHGLSYSELEDFVSDVARRQVLSVPGSDAKKIIAQCLDQRKTRFK
jgi:AAA+ superfamily predicted ATPase